MYFLHNNKTPFKIRPSECTPVGNGKTFASNSLQGMPT
jgi:hypothetical protein